MNNTYMQKAIANRLNPKLEEPRRQIMLHLHESTIAQLTQLAAALSAYSGKKITRNMLIVDAIDVFLEESKIFMTEQKNKEVTNE